jgi:hypothetical protein
LRWASSMNVADGVSGGPHRCPDMPATKHLLNRDQIHAALVVTGGAVMPEPVGLNRISPPYPSRGWAAACSISSKLASRLRIVSPWSRPPPSSQPGPRRSFPGHAPPAAPATAEALATAIQPANPVTSQVTALRPGQSHFSGKSQARGDNSVPSIHHGIASGARDIRRGPPNL